MTDSDVFRFQSVLKRLCVTFRVRTDTDDFKVLAESYFDALRGWPFDDLERGAEAWISGQTRFPKPIEWKQAIPRKQVELIAMGMSEAREYTRAELKGWEDDPCGCQHCVAAHVSDKPLRFVPDFDDNDTELRATHPNRAMAVTRGHWAHGDELARWYEARANFYNAYFAITNAFTAEKRKKKRPFLERLEEIYAKPREKDGDFTPLKDLL